MSKTKSRNRPVLGVEYARFVSPPPFTQGRRPRGAKRQGHLFEQTVQADLERLFGDGVICNAWILFTDLVYGERLCSPDAMVIDPELGKIILVECKLTHTPSAYGQLDKYKAVVQKLFPNYEIVGIEVYKYINGGTPYPVAPQVVTDIRSNFKGIGNIMLWQTKQI